MSQMGFPKIRIWVPILKIIAFGLLYWGPCVYGNHKYTHCFFSSGPYIRREACFVKVAGKLKQTLSFLAPCSP